MNTLHLPNPIRLRAVRQAIAHRATATCASTTATRRALATALHEMQEGRSAAVAIAVALKTLRAPRTEAGVQ